MAAALGLSFKEAILEIEAKHEELQAVKTDGLENQLVNEIALTAQWEVDSVWSFKKPSQINLLEEGCVLRLLQNLARLKRPVRAVNLVDSFVVRGATSKGRSSSLGLSTVLRKVFALQVAAAIYLTVPFVPTRLNPSDDPTRDVDLRAACDGLCVDSWDENEIYQLAKCSGMRRWAANWFRIMLRIFGSSWLSWKCRATHRRSMIADKNRSWPFDFDSTLGFPGEGPRNLGLFSASVVLLFGFCLFASSLDFTHLGASHDHPCSGLSLDFLPVGMLLPSLL